MNKQESGLKFSQVTSGEQYPTLVVLTTCSGGQASSSPQDESVRSADLTRRAGILPALFRKLTRA
jgi:hypothetical protein